MKLTLAILVAAFLLVISVPGNATPTLDSDYDANAMVDSYVATLSLDRLRSAARADRSSLLLLARLVQPMPEPLRTQYAHFLMADRLNNSPTRILTEVSNHDIALNWAFFMLVVERGDRRKNIVTNQMKSFFLLKRAEVESDPLVKQMLAEMGFTISFYTALHDLHPLSGRYALKFLAMLEGTSPVLFTVPEDAAARIHVMIDLAKGNPPGNGADPETAARAQAIYEALLARLRERQEGSGDHEVDDELTRERRVELLARLHRDTIEEAESYKDPEPAPQPETEP